jgi:cytochrome oxidase Cu insertion factor (SCO1/SenC/PrrC family)
MKKVLSIVFFQLFLLTISGQTVTHPEPLKIKDTVPDIVFDQLFNYSAKTARLATFKGKLVILDFWGTFCSACINTFPKMDSLQKQFPDGLKIVMVDNLIHTYDKEDSVVRFLGQYRMAHPGFSLTAAIMRSEQLRSLFPNNGLPHCVWISPDGRLLSTTFSDEVNADNIASVLHGCYPLMALKQD